MPASSVRHFAQRMTVVASTAWLRRTSKRVSAIEKVNALSISAMQDRGLEQFGVRQSDRATPADGSSADAAPQLQDDKDVEERADGNARADDRCLERLALELAIDVQLAPRQTRALCVQKLHDRRL
jgi:hypothetical protein